MTQQTENYRTAGGNDVKIYQTPNTTWAIGTGSGWSRPYDTREAAIAVFEAEERAGRHNRSFFGPIDRETYERLCQATGVDAIPDGEISDNYGIRYGDFSMSHYSEETRDRMHLARRRQSALEDEAKARRAQQPATSAPIISCPNCGRETYRSNLMNASLGTACPECYDDLSDEY